MYWLDNNTGIATAPDVPAVISATKRFFTNGGLGVPPSVPEDFWFHMIQEELLGVLTLAGIAPAKGDLNQIANAIQSIAFSAYPVGAPIPWPTAVPPLGFLAMSGQSFDPVTYPILADAYPSGTLPDMRGLFIRGLDAGRNIDAGRVLLSEQKASFLSIDDSGSGVTVDCARGSLSSVGLDAVSIATDYVGISLSYTVSNVLSSTPSGGGVRPRNRSFYYIVRVA